MLAGFSGKELIQGEPDASSFPTGGFRLRHPLGLEGAIPLSQLAFPR